MQYLFIVKDPSYNKGQKYPLLVNSFLLNKLVGKNLNFKQKFKLQFGAVLILNTCKECITNLVQIRSCSQTSSNVFGDQLKQVWS